MGKGDRSTRRGKIFAGSHGSARLRAGRKHKKARPTAVLAVPPPTTERRPAPRRQTTTPAE